MKTKTEATQRPWQSGPKVPSYVYARDGLDIICQCDTMGEESRDREIANAALIVQAVNNHDELVRALKPFAALDISDCPHCQGNGLQYPEPCKDACHTCGGTGEVVSQVLPEDVRQARAALQMVKGGE